MDTKFPVMEVAKASLGMPLKSPVNILKALGVMILSAVIGILLMMIIAMLLGTDFETLGPVMQQVAAGNMEAASGLGGLAVGYIVLIFTMIVGISFIFNYWVRFAAFGAGGAKISPFSTAVRAAMVNAVKFLFIGILIVVVSIVVMYVLNMLGISPGFMEQAMIEDATEQYRAGFAATVISTVAACFIYSMFSANLTQTAIGDDKEPLEHPHTVDFAVVLMLIYAAVIIPTLIAALMGSIPILFTVQVIFGIYVGFAIPAAHGLRYQICARENMSHDENT